MASAAAVTILTTVAGAAITAAINQVAPTLANLSKWDEVREAFTQQTVQALWDKNPAGYGAAICYNQDYEVSNPKQQYETTSVRLELQLLHTDYDCFYIIGPDNHFWSRGDGGYQNVAIITDDSKCQYDGSTGDVYCH